MFAACLLTISASPAQPVGNGNGGVALTPIGDFNNPTYVENAPGFKRLLFVVERSGVIRVVRNGHLLPAPFLDVSAQVAEQTDEGMLSLAFPHDYAKSRRFYVYATGLDGDNRVLEFKRSRRNDARALPSTQRKVLTIPHPDDNPYHDGGQIQFGPDGDLYISVGDGTASFDGEVSPEIAQDINSPLGKLLRIQPLPTKRGRAHSVPRDNPFVGKPGLNLIYSYGLRNPFRFSFDSAGGAIAIGDVGQGSREEIDYRKRGHARGINFGWPRWEGTVSFDADISAPGAVFPIHEYDHADDRCAIIAGFVVRDPRLRRLYGRLIYGDYCTGILHRLIPHQSGATDDRPIPGLNPLDALYSFGQGRGGRIYVATDSAVFRLDPL